jgi:hypothetical protein
MEAFLWNCVVLLRGACVRSRPGVDLSSMVLSDERLRGHVVRFVHHTTQFGVCGTQGYHTRGGYNSSRLCHTFLFVVGNRGGLFKKIKRTIHKQQMDLSLLNVKGTKNTYEFHVDSSFRDRVLHPNPNNYTIEFMENYRNVVGLEVVDARIPKTEYIIHEHNNRIVIEKNDEDVLECFLPEGDYTKDQLVSQFHSSMGALVGSGQHFELSILENKSKFVFTSSFHFNILLEETTARAWLGFDTVTDSAVHSIEDVDQFKTWVLMSLDESYDKEDYILSALDVVYYQPLRLPVREEPITYFLRRVDVPGMSTVSNENMRDTIVYKMDVVEILHSHRTILGTTQYNGSSFVFDEPVEMYHTPDTEYELQLYFTNREWFDTARVKVPAHKSNAFPGTSRSEGVEWDIEGQTVEQERKSINDLYATRGFVGVAMKVVVEERKYSVTPPGRFNLLGDPYVVMRCNEFDAHFPNGIKRANHRPFLFGTVIRLYDLDQTSGNEERFRSHSKYPVDFTPTDKLSRLSFRFEKLDGTLYDFKGYNHNFTVRLYCMHMKANIQSPFMDQTVFKDIEAINEREQYFTL